MTLAGRIRARGYRAALERRAAEEAAEVAAPERGAVQLELLNREWARVLSECPYFTRLREERGLPERFDSLADFAARVPPTTRSDVQAHGHEMASRSRAPDAVRMTGGSTSAPVQIPAWKSEARFVGPDMWVGRSWYGVGPADRLVLLWGHSHLLGSGLPARLRARLRELDDWLLGYRRISAYDLSPAAMRRAGDELLRFRPDWVLGYSVALDTFARANGERAGAFRDLGIRVVVGTAEAFPSPEARQRVGELFGCPVAMEYGAVETGVLAHTHPTGGYRVFWRTNLLEAPGEGLRRPLLVTSLRPRSFPLVRYEIGDEVDLHAEHEPGLGLARFERVAGRCNDYVDLPDGAQVHSEAFSHAVRPCAAVRGFQVVQKGPDLRLRYAAERLLDSGEESEIRRRLGVVHPELAGISFERVGSLDQTVAGKTRMILRQ